VGCPARKVTECLNKDVWVGRFRPGVESGWGYAAPPTPGAAGCGGAGAHDPRPPNNSYLLCCSKFCCVILTKWRKRAHTQISRNHGVPKLQMNTVFRQLFAALHGLAVAEERRHIIRLWSMAKSAHRAPDSDLENAAAALSGMHAPQAQFSHAAYVATLCVLAHERKVRRILRSCTA